MALDLSDEQIRQLLSVSKRLTSTPNPRLKVKGKHDERDYVLQGQDGETFSVYARQSTILQDGFSFGLRWVSMSGEEVTLIRANGSNHVHPNVLEATRIVLKCHVHVATAKYIKAGLRPEGFTEECSEYTDLRGAMLVLGRRCNIIDGPFVSQQKDLF